MSASSNMSASSEIKVLGQRHSMPNPDSLVDDVFTESKATIKIYMFAMHEWMSAINSSGTAPQSKYVGSNDAVLVYSTEIGFSDLFQPRTVTVSFEHLVDLESRIDGFCRGSSIEITPQHMWLLKQKLRELLQGAVEAVIAGKQKEVLVLNLFGVRALHVCADEQECTESYQDFKRRWGHLFRDPDADQLPDPSSSLASLRTKIFVAQDSESNSSCSVCLEMFHGGVEVKETPCSHIYHTHCIEKWLHKANTCPMCRSIL